MGSSQGAEGNKNGGVNCPAIVEDDADYLSNVFFFGFGCCWGFVGCICVLYCCAIGGYCVWVGLHLGSVGRFVAKSHKGIFNVTWHGEVYLAFDIIPI